jgi:putative nucleotidyltransferase with HDIG domain
MLLFKAAESIKKVCRENDVIARWGGDEFIIILPGTKKEEARDIAKNIKNKFAGEYIKAFKGNISIGYDTKYILSENILHIIENAEHKMYLKKYIDHKNFKNSITVNIIKTLFNRSQREKEHSIRVSKLCKIIGEAINLSETDINLLKIAGYLHDIGKIVLEESLLNKVNSLTAQDWQEIRRHPITGFRILSSSDSTSKLAEYVLYHHERWNGSGYPNGLKGEEIPLISRIIAVTESYDEMVNEATYKKAMNKEIAINELLKNAGVQFDPDIVDVLINIIK